MCDTADVMVHLLVVITGELFRTVRDNSIILM